MKKNPTESKPPRDWNVKPLWLAGFLVVQVLFVAAGLAIIFWTLDRWQGDHGIDALFGAGLGGFAFFFTWNLIRSWARANVDVWRRPTAK